MTFEDIEPELQRRSVEYHGIARHKSLSIFDMAKLAEPAPEQEFVLPGHIPSNEMGLITGGGGAGKSYLMQQLGNCRASGRPFLGISVPIGPTLYITAEDGEPELHRRQQRIEKGLGIPTPDRLFLSSLRGCDGNELVSFDRDGAMQKTETFHRLKATIAETGATLLILDNLAHLFSGNENDRGQVTKFCNALYSLRRDIARDFGIRQDLTIILVGHPNKSGDSYSGSTAWLNAVRFQLELTRPEDAAHDLDARVLRLGKANYSRTGTETRFRWHDFAFRLDSELPRDVMAEIAEVGRMNADDDIFLACLTERNRQERPVSEHPSANYAPKVFEKMREAKGIGKKRLTDAMDRLFRTGKIRRDIVGQDKQRRPKEGLIVVGEVHQTPASNAHQTPAQDCIKPSAQTASQTPPYTTYKKGAGPEGPRAPSIQEVE